MIHIFTAASQPATGFVDRCGEDEIRFGYKPGRRLMCQCCWKRHLAKNVVVQCFYDGMNFWCAPGRGCKSPAFMEAKRRREFHNRSRAQKARFANAAKITQLCSAALKR